MSAATGIAALDQTLHWVATHAGLWMVVLVVLGLWMLGAYNRLTALRGAILAAWGPLEAALLVRAQALDTLLDAVGEALQDERAALDAVALAQAQVAAAMEPVRRRPVVAAGVADLARADATLASGSLRLLALIEHQAELRSQALVAAQLAVLSDAKPRLRFARQAFNDAGQRYNEALAQFPTRLLVSVFRFEPAGPF